MFYSLLEVLLFIVCIIVCFYIPGRLVCLRLRYTLNGIESLFVSTSLGLVIFIAVLYPLAWLHLEWLSILLYITWLVLAFRQRKKLFIPIEKSFIKPLVFLAISAAIFSLALVAWGQYGDSIVWTYDDAWHLALIRELQYNFPPQVPTYAGLALTGYHFFNDFLLANVSRLFFITPLSLHFHLFPVLLSCLWALGVFVFVSDWTKNRSAALWAVFLTMFGGSFAFIYQLQGHVSVNMVNGLGILQPARSVYNPPFTFSIIILVLGLFLLHRYWQTKEKRWMIPVVVIAGVLPMIKVYAGILLFGALGILTFAECVKRKYFLLEILIASTSCFIATYGFFVGKAGGLIWFPLWSTHEVLMNFEWYGYTEKMYTFTKNHVIKGIIETEVYGLFVYIFGNLGTRLIGLLFLFLIPVSRKKLPSLFSFSLLAIIFVSLFMPLSFIQTGKVFEMKQMAMYFLFFCSLFSAIGIATFFSLHFRFSRVVKSVFFILFIIFTIPSTLISFQQIYAQMQEKHDVHEPYYRAITFLENQGSHNDIVLVIPPPDVRPRAQDYFEWYKHSMPDVSAFGNKRLYITFGVMEYPGMHSKARLAKLTGFMANPIPDSQRGFLENNHIKYVFSKQRLPSIERIGDVKLLYKDTYFIYEYIQK